MIPLYLDAIGQFAEKHRDFLISFGNLESRLLRYDIEDINITKPVFISGLPRSGTTILLEILHTHPDFVSHHYGDYPFAHVNYFWNMARAPFPKPKTKTERAHKDRINVNTQSPEALDEIIWMSFFDDLHKTDTVNIRDVHTSHPDFECFYSRHIRKLLLLRAGNRYLSKNNYNFSRIDYIRKIFPDCRFIVPLREPLGHVYSLCKQHKIMTENQIKDVRALNFMRRHGHFEFGQDFRPVNLGYDRGRYGKILDLWENDKFVEAYAHYWNYVYKYIYDFIYQNAALRPSCYFIRYDDLCIAPEKHINEIFAFCDTGPLSVTTSWAAKISAPDYYKIDFTEAEHDLITDITGETKRLFWS